MRKYLKYLRVRRKVKSQMSYHFYMMHWKAASNLCRRIDRLERTYWGYTEWVRNIYGDEIIWGGYKRSVWKKPDSYSYYLSQYLKREA